MYQFLFIFESSEADDSSFHCARIDWANTVWKGLQGGREREREATEERKEMPESKV